MALYSSEQWNRSDAIVIKDLCIKSIVYISIFLFLRDVSVSLLFFFAKPPQPAAPGRLGRWRAERGG